MDLENLPNDLAEKGYGIIRENIGKFQSPFSTGYACYCSQRPQIVLHQVKEESLRLGLSEMFGTHSVARSLFLSVKYNLCISQQHHKNNINAL